MTTGNIQYSNSIPGFQFTSTDVWSGVDGRTNPDGSPKDNAYTRTRARESNSWSTGTSCYYNSRVPNIACSNLSVGCGDRTSHWDGSDTNKLLNKLASKVRTHDFNMGIVLGEGRKTMRLVTGTIVGLKRSFIAGLTGKAGDVLRFGQQRRLTQADISSVYLQTVFGALPLIRDTFEAMKAFEAITASRKSSLHVVHRRSWDVDSSCSPSNYHSWGTLRESQRIFYEMSERISQARELGILSPYQVAWELTPWSFLFDYFLPFGSYLENVALIPSLKGRFILTIKREYESATDRPVEHTSPTGYTTAFYRGSQSSYQLSHFQRIPLSGLSVPAPNVVDLRQALKPWRIANIIALSHQQVLRVIKKYT